MAIELDIDRYIKLVNQANGQQPTEEKINFKELLKSNNLTVMIVSSILSYSQRKMGEEVGVKPGSEMLEAAKIAQETNADIALIDRNIQITLKRTIKSMGLKEKLMFAYGIIKETLFGDDEEKEELLENVDELTNEDTLEEVMGYFKEASPKGYNALVHERDEYMAHNLLTLKDKNVVAVVGAGHKEGIESCIKNPETILPISELTEIKESRFSIGKIILYSIPLLIILLFLVAFLQGINIEGGVINFVLYAVCGAFIGSLIARSKVQSAIVGAVVAPLTVLHPLLAAGWFSGLIEAKLRHVGMKDLDDLSHCDSIKEFLNNNLMRVLLVVVGTNIGCSIGVFLTIPNTFLPLISKIWGG